MSLPARGVPRVRVAALISGRGSNMQAIVEASRGADYPAQVVLVVSNDPEAGGLESAQAAGIEARAVPHRPFGKDRGLHEAAIDALLQEAGVELVVLAGYMRVLTPWLVGRWRRRMLNIHPSLLPKYPGLDTHARALAAGDTRHGCSVHLVSEGVDEGPLLGQAEVPVEPGDTAETLAARVLTAEHSLYPAVLADYARRLRADGV